MRLGVKMGMVLFSDFSFGVFRHLYTKEWKDGAKSRKGRSAGSQSGSKCSGEKLFSEDSSITAFQVIDIQLNSSLRLCSMKQLVFFIWGEQGPY